MKDQQPAAAESPTASSNVKSHGRLICSSIILLLVVASALGFYIWLSTHRVPSSNNTLRILDRSEWKGEPPTNRTHLRKPVANIIISHTATEPCESEDVCIYRMQAIQRYHMQSLGYPDIGYNFLVGGDGQVYVGRGWHAQGAHVRGYGSISIGIAFIGTFTNVLPPTRQVVAAKQLMAEGVRLNNLTPDYHIYAHRQLSPTESPGQQLYDLIKTWPRWSQEVGPLRRVSNETLRFVSRNYWLAQPAEGTPQPLALPVGRVRFVSTQTEACKSQAKCTFQVRSLQTQHMEIKHLTDINYNFVVGGDGNVYVARGWQQSCDADSDEEAYGLVVAFIAQEQPQPNQMEVARVLLEQGVTQGYLAKNYELEQNFTMSA